MPPVLLAGLGGALGAAARYALASAVVDRAGVPWGTLSVNLIGALLMGLLAGLAMRTGFAEGWRVFLGAGVLGGFTTFSAFGLECWTMAARGGVPAAVAYAAASVIGATVLTGVGVWCTR